MKKYSKIIFAAFLAIAALSLQSCLKDQTDYFDKTAAARMQDALDNAREVLTSSGNGWVMEYFVGNSQADHGGYNIVLSFTEDEVTATSERDPEYTTTTYYKLTTDDGPVLSFDSYTEVLHYFATPAGSGSLYQGQGGDFEFLILEATKDKVVLKGKRSGKISTLTPLAEDADSYIAKIVSSVGDFAIGEVKGSINGKPVHAEIDLDYRQFYIYEVDGDGVENEETEVSSPYIYSTTGIKFYEPLEIAGATISSFDFDANTLALTTSDASVELVGVVPEDYLPFNFFEGTYSFKCYSGTYNVTLEKGEGKTYILKGISDKFDLVVDYISAKGRLHLGAQAVGTDSGYTVVMAPWDLGNGGTLYPGALGVGVEFVWNKDKEKPVFTFVSDGGISGFNTDSFILWYLNDAGSSAGAASSCSWFKWNSYQWPYIGNSKYTKLTKK